MSDVPDKVLEQIQKLLQLASKNTNEHEAGAAMAKAQKLLQEHNLTFEAVSSAQVGKGARQKTAVEGGYYDYERELWKSVARLNFCLYWYTREHNKDRQRNTKGYLLKYFHYHNVVGRKVNVVATTAMADYLLQAATRLAFERARGWNESYRFDNWANSYRRGVVYRIVQNLEIRRNDTLREEKERESTLKQQASGASTSTTLSLQVFIDKETDANLDFVYGEGYSAKRAAERAEEAHIARQRQRGHTRWAAAHPEEAAAKDKALRRHRRRHGSGGTSRADRNLDHSAFWSGYEDGKAVSIDQQVDTPKPAGLL